ncbi:HutD family protein, partial [Undibacterium luofuense]
MRHWTLHDYLTMPWKNGGGSTTELAVFPEQAGLDQFIWRLSTAS